MGDEWGTPQDLFDGIVKKVGSFDLDVCASKDNYKVNKYYTIEDDGLKQEWNGKCWCNPPYSDIEPWVNKAIYAIGKKGYQPSHKIDTPKVVMLLPVNTDTKWFQKVFNNVKDIVFIKGRLSFEGEQNYPARFPSCLAFFDNRFYFGNVHFWTCDREYNNVKRVSY